MRYLSLPIPSLVFALVLAPRAHADILRVPEDYEKLQDAVAAADWGDVVEIACGEYAIPTIIPPVGMAIRSETGQPDCVTLRAIVRRRHFIADRIGFHLEGLKLVRGQTTNRPYLGFPPWGGSILAVDGGVRLLNCEIESDGAFRGAAIAADNSTVTLRNVKVSAGYAYDYGGIFYATNGSRLDIWHTEFGGAGGECRNGYLSPDSELDLHCTHFELDPWCIRGEVRRDPGSCENSVALPPSSWSALRGRYGMR